jgi:hypothetical protein
VVAVKKSGDEILRSLPDETADIRQIFSSGCCEEKRKSDDPFLMSFCLLSDIWRKKIKRILPRYKLKSIIINV